MCLKDLLERLRREGIAVTESQIRWAIASGKIGRPSLDGSLRYVFDGSHVEQIAALSSSKQEVLQK